ncbi:MAG: hypothetical protein H0V44_09535 [Planctomycetes bacterium]|nr:hypothetical protein [Planctomycetota bacterium]
MIMADVLAWFLVISGAYLILVAYWLAAVALFPVTVERCRDLYGKRSVVSSLVGVVALVPVAILAALATTIPHPVVSGVIVALAMIPILLALTGSAGLALRIGSGLSGQGDGRGRSVLRGGGVLGLTFLLPFLGWFVVLPWALISGLGAAILAMHGARAAPALVPHEAVASLG